MTKKLCELEFVVLKVIDDNSCNGMQIYKKILSMGYQYKSASSIYHHLQFLTKKKYISKTSKCIKFHTEYYYQIQDKGTEYLDKCMNLHNEILKDERYTLTSRLIINRNVRNILN